ncbi:NAD-P-binding protein [Mycena capillaripes]|nr:NAD-P-binding protein [Mycena capillaripes]
MGTVAGYVGGSILSRLLERRDENLNLNALVRSVEKAEKLRALDVRLNIIIGSHNDAELVERITSEADVVFSLADCDDLEAAESILRGLKKRFAITGIKPILIHMSGTGCLGDAAKGMFSSSTIYNDTDIAQIETLPETQPHRNVDLAIIEADTQGYLDSYIVIPGLFFGTPRGILVDARVQNPTNLALTAYIKASFDRRAAGIVGPGKNIIALVDVTDTADLVEKLYNAVEMKPGAHGKNGYYFVTNGDIAFEKLVEVVETRAGARRTFTQLELDTYFPGRPSLHSFFGDNGRADSERSRALGWKPVKTAEDFLVALRDEVEHWAI